MARNGINNKLSIKTMFKDHSFMCVYLGICKRSRCRVTLCESARPTTPRTEHEVLVRMAVGKQALARNTKLFFDFPFTSSVTHRGCGSQCVVWLLSENSIVYQCTRFYIFVCVVWMRIMLD